MFRVIEKYRVTVGQMATPTNAGLYGRFLIPSPYQKNTELNVIATNGEGVSPQWEHVSVHAVRNKKTKIPSWYEMQYIKGLFWEPDDVVLQFHVGAEDHINLHKHVLHLWRAVDEVQPLPPKILV